MADNKIEVAIDGDASGFEKASSSVSASTIAIGNILADLGKSAVSALGNLVNSAIDTGEAFETSMSNVTALQKAAGATDEDIALLKETAEEYGASTQYTMAECADALGYMALAGWDADQSAEALSGVLSLAATFNIMLLSLTADFATSAFVSQN